MTASTVREKAVIDIELRDRRKSASEKGQRCAKFLPIWLIEILLYQGCYGTATLSKGELISLAKTIDLGAWTEVEAAVIPSDQLSQLKLR